MSKTHILLAGLGLAAVLAVPALAMAKGSGGDRSCCDPAARCCTPKSACCDTGEKVITCPLTGEPIQESECPLCQGSK